jgi:predicted transglutaminase-like cysteine proteinase
VGKTRFFSTYIFIASAFSLAGLFIPCRASAGDNSFEVSRTGTPRPSLFGTSEVMSSDTNKFIEWSHMLRRFDGEIHASENKRIVDKWQAALQPLKNLSLEQKAVQVNDMMNRIPYIPDEIAMKKLDDWATPIEFMARDAGDCEDFAIAKYASLQALGVPRDRMRVVVLRDTAKNIPHAVLALYTKKGIMILDNQAKTVRYDTQISNYEPIYSINGGNWWMHGRRIASAVFDGQSRQQRARLVQ